ncbi:putative deoxyhypusine synthase [Trypanosoma vivax]|nr:putative deoxyhypusine synthase [Trypanosoma vivax]
MPPTRSSTQTITELDYSALVQMPQEDALRLVISSYQDVGLQATQAGRARAVLQRTLANKKRFPGNKVFLAYTSNLMSSGLRDTFAFLARERLVDAVVTTAGGVEEDVIKCLGKTLVGNFSVDDAMLRRNGINRVGNLFVPNDNYCSFEDFFVPVLELLHKKQSASRWQTMTAPSDFIREMGAALDSMQRDARESSLVYWCYRNEIPIFCPALTDGSMGDMIYFYNFSKKGLLVDPIPDAVKLRRLGACGENAPMCSIDTAVKDSAAHVTCIILGGGLPKHHLLRNVRARTVVCVATGLEADGCESSCSFVDDKANELIGEGCEVVRVHGDATIVLPIVLFGVGTLASVQ